ncbi:glycogenin glucosyltransferase-like protein [Galdieria sulphuraria]|uniref:Glycogenin glucosyltransferase-like protein n=1 Tax=Galdieria sulphuraria TaxID=130081 RepID=M2W8M7_GALSU|nr:glycogenin glucosyltransferase-like protein [Galdieria sulphuraria]EME32231.1 glycogenin glucosyltransferase-like protein [Galdieria sulphuraria]|eukprot:XP_005708751.1 glycogenin glucosyltransferase-like protein [Galdieria sulphuraria]
MKAAKVASAIRASYSPRKEELGSKCITVDTLCQLRAWNYRKCRAKVAIATLVTATFYVPGALTLLKSFQGAAKEELSANFDFDCVCLVTDRVEASEVRYLKQAGWLIKHVHRLPVLGCSEEDLVSEHFMECYQKLWLWTMEEYVGILYIDADAIVTRPVSHIFRALSFSPIGFAAAPDWDLDKRCFYKDYFNAGVLAIRPCFPIFEDMCKKLANHRPVNGFAEQDFLNDYYARDIYQIWSGFHVGMTWLHPGCNALKFVYVDSSQVWNSIYDTICIVHYAHKKPWKLLKNTSCLHVGLSYEPDERRDCFENSKCWILHDYWHIIRAMPQDHREFPFPPRAVPDSYNPLQEYRRLDQVIERYIPKADKSEGHCGHLSFMQLSNLIWDLYSSKEFHYDVAMHFLSNPLRMQHVIQRVTPQVD